MNFTQDPSDPLPDRIKVGGRGPRSLSGYRGQEEVGSGSIPVLHCPSQKEIREDSVLGEGGVVCGSYRGEVNEVGTPSAPRTRSVVREERVLRYPGPLPRLG